MTRRIKKIPITVALLALAPVLSAQAKGRVLLSLGDVVEDVSPGVVNIQARVPSSANDAGVVSRRGQVDKFFQMFLLPGVAGEGGETKSLGSGFFYKSDEFVVTNYHVVRDASRITLVNAKGMRAEAKLVGFDARNDIALLNVKSFSTNKVLRFGNSDKLRIGDPVFAIGNPFGYGHTVTSGILSAKGRTIGAGPLDDFLQTDAAINPGNSGGPLFNLSGEVVGINTAISEEGSGISFAISSETAAPIINALLENKKLHRAWLGVIGSNLDEEGNRGDAIGVYVQNIVRDSPADKAGLKAGDVIMKVESQPAQSLVQVQGALGKIPAGKPVSLKVFRGGGNLKITVRTAPGPENPNKESF